MFYLLTIREQAIHAFDILNCVGSQGKEFSFQVGKWFLFRCVLFLASLVRKLHERWHLS